MDLELNEEQQAFREAAQEFAAARMAPFAAQWDAEHHFPKEVFSAGGELGFCGLYANESIGGLGASRLSAADQAAQAGFGAEVAQLARMMRDA